MAINCIPSRIEGWLNILECPTTHSYLDSSQSFMIDAKHVWEAYFCILLVNEKQLIYCHNETKAQNELPAHCSNSVRLGDARTGGNNIRLGDVKTVGNGARIGDVRTTSKSIKRDVVLFTSKDSAYEKGSGMGSTVGKEGELFSSSGGDQTSDDYQRASTPSRIASFFGRKILRSQLKRTKSANKLDRRSSDSPAETRQSLPPSTSCSCTSSLTRSLSLRNKPKENRPISRNQPTQRYGSVLQLDTSAMSTSKSQECLSANQMTMLKVDLSGPGIEIRPLHSSITGQEHCFQLITPRGSTCYSCRTAKERQHWIEYLRKSIHPSQELNRRTENSLQFWILEAKNIATKKKYYCEFFLDKTLYGRTSVKSMADILFWGERFEFSHMPPSDTLTVHLYREVDKKRKKESKRTMIGYLHVALSDLKGSQLVEKWFSMNLALVGQSGKENRNELPLVRLKARYLSTAVLPTILYSDLIAYLQQNSLLLVEVLEPQLGIKAKDELASTLINVMQRMNLATGFLTEIIMAEVAKLDNNHLMFRGNSIATKAMETYMRLVGDKYIKDTLGDVINTILENADDCEVDPAKVTNNSTLISNQENLTMYCDMVWLKIVSSHHYFPRELQEIFHAVRKRCADVNRPDITDNLLSSCIFLRCLCPAILSPSLWGLIQEFPNERSIRNLTLVAKVIQSIANCSKFENKEYFMTFLNDFVEREISHMKKFLQDISIEPKDNGNSFDGYIDLGRELAVLHSLLSDNINKLNEEQKSKLGTLKEVLSDISDHMNNPNKHESVTHKNALVLQDIATSPSRVKQYASNSLNRIPNKPSPFTNNKKSRIASRPPTKYSTVEDSQLLTTVDVQPSDYYLQPSVSSVLCHIPDPARVNESWNKMVSAADMVNGDYVDLISFIDDPEAQRKSMLARKSTDLRPKQLPINVVPIISRSSSTTLNTSASSASSTLVTGSNNAQTAHHPLAFSNPLFSCPSGKHYSDRMMSPGDQLSASTPLSVDEQYVQSYDRLVASFHIASQPDIVCKTCGRQNNCTIASSLLDNSLQELCSDCGGVWDKQGTAVDRVKTFTSLPSPTDGFSSLSSDGWSSWRSNTTPTMVKMGINGIERHRSEREKSKHEYEVELFHLRDELARTQAMLLESQRRLKSAEEKAQRPSESEDTLSAISSIERRRFLEPPGQRVRSLDAANNRLLEALSDLRDKDDLLLSNSLTTSTLL